MKWVEGVGGGIGIQGSGFRVQGADFRDQGSGFRVQGSGFRVHSSRFRSVTAWQGFGRGLGGSILEVEVDKYALEHCGMREGKESDRSTARGDRLRQAHSTPGLTSECQFTTLSTR